MLPSYILLHTLRWVGVEVIFTSPKLWFPWQGPADLTLSAISLPPKLSTSQRREKCPQIFHHEGPRSFVVTALTPAGPLTHHGSAWHLRALPCPAAHAHPGRVGSTLCPHWILIILSYLRKWFSLPLFDLGVGMWLTLNQRDTWENPLGDF